MNWLNVEYQMQSMTENGFYSVNGFYIINGKMTAEKILKNDWNKYSLIIKKNVEEYIRKRNDAKERVKILVNFVLPLINNFSTKYTKYSVWEIYTIEQILEMEGIKDDE